MKLLSFSNRKLGNMASFSLPTTTCGCGAAQQGCIKYCYAKKMETFRKNCFTKWVKNGEETFKPTFVSKVDAELKKAKPTMVRWHVSGDFYSQEYVDKVFEIARLNPTVSFYTYTKAIQFDYSKRPNNFNIILSDDNMIWQAHHNMLDGVATIIFKGKGAVPSGFTVCLNQASHGKTLCSNCNICTKKGCRVAFIKH